MKLLLKMPTRSRPDRVREVLPRYFAFLSGKVDVAFIISCDTSDKSMNNDTIRKELSRYPHLQIQYDDFSGKIDAYNGHTNVVSDWHVMAVTSDDMMPMVVNYDLQVVDAFRKFFPDTDGVLHFNDGFTGVEVNTLPIIGRKYFERFGYVYHSSYRSMYADNEFTVHRSCAMP